MDVWGVREPDTRLARKVHHLMIPSSGHCGIQPSPALVSAYASGVPSDGDRHVTIPVHSRPERKAHPDDIPSFKTTIIPLQWP
jgi:hypothetical protein